MKVLITGITGFVGSHLADFILKNFVEIEVFGLKRDGSRLENIEHLAGKIKYFESDINNEDGIYQIVNDLRPEIIFHLAAQSNVSASWSAPSETLVSNVVGECYLLEAVKKIKTKEKSYDPVILVAGSSEEYGLVYPDEIPIKETNQLRPLSPYGVSKVCQDLLGFQYWHSYGLKVVRSRAFNHSGPRRDKIFVDSNFAWQIARIEKGLQAPEILVGNLEAKRDFTDVADIVWAYWLAAQKGQAGEVYNICSGKSYGIRQILDKLLSLSINKNIKDIKIVPDSARMRPSDIPLISGDCSKFKETTGWQPQIDYLNQTLADMLNYWRQNV